MRAARRPSIELMMEGVEEEKKKKKKKKSFFFHTSFFFRTTKKTYMTRNKPATRPGAGATKVCRSLGEEEEGLRRTSRNTSSS